MQDIEIQLSYSYPFSKARESELAVKEITEGVGKHQLRELANVLELHKKITKITQVGIGLKSSPCSYETTSVAHIPFREAFSSQKNVFFYFTTPSPFFNSKKAGLGLQQVVL